MHSTIAMMGLQQQYAQQITLGQQSNQRKIHLIAFYYVSGKASNKASLLFSSQHLVFFSVPHKLS